MKVNILNILILMTGLFFVSSCSSDLFEDWKGDENEVLSTDNVGLLVTDTECLEIQYPITLQYPDESAVEVSSNEELKETIKAWHETKPPKGERVEIVFPIEVTFQGEAISVENHEQFRQYMKECFGGKGGKGGHKGKKDFFKKLFNNECFEMQFPLTFIMPNDEEVSANSAEEMIEALKQWKENNKDVKGKPEFKYPIQVEKDGEILELSDHDSFKELLEDCNFKGGHHGKHGKHFLFKLLNGDCVDVVYPISITLPDNSTLTANSIEELKNGLIEWKESNPDIKGKPSLNFPQDFIKDGETVTINSMEELKELVKDCFDKKKCFELVFPITMIMPDNSTIEGNSKHQMHKDIKSWYKSNPSYIGQKPNLQFPVQIKYEDGTITEINSKEALEQAKDECE